MALAPAEAANRGQVALLEAGAELGAAWCPAYWGYALSLVSPWELWTHPSAQPHLCLLPPPHEPKGRCQGQSRGS